MTPFVSELLRVCRYFAAFERETVCCGTITVPQCLVLQQLSQAGPSDVSSLSAFAGTSVSAMTRLVDGLERRGWVRRRRSEEDRRRVEVELTDAGGAEAQRLVGLTELAVGAVVSCIPDGEREPVLNALRTVRRAMEQAAERGSLSCCKPASRDSSA